MEVGQLGLFEDNLPQRLQALGIRNVQRILTHTNQTVMLSLYRGVLRIHQGYAYAPDHVLRAVIRFLSPRVPRGHRKAAEREFLSFPVHDLVRSRKPVRRPRIRPGDRALLHRLEAIRSELNQRHFEGGLVAIPIRLSGRMRSRLGELVVDLESRRPREIVLSRRHIALHPWPEVEHTLLHELVHQWQAEAGLEVDHGPSFRAKAREVGVLPAARRQVRRSFGTSLS
jgi:hypothetical protein